jgi:hypothetical protein
MMLRCVLKAASEDIIKNFILFSIAILALLTAGCGGSSGSASTFVPAGIYRSQFTRGVGTPSLMIATVKVDGTADIVISDADGLEYSGTAYPSAFRFLTGTLNGPGGSLDFEGEYSGGALAALLLAAGNAVAQALMAAVQDNDINFGASTPFTGPLTVNTTGEDLGTASLIVSSSGSVSGTATSPVGGSFPVTGSVTPQGAISFQGTGSLGTSTLAFLYTGILHQKPTLASDVAGTGTYQVDGYSWGDWTAD